ncbi:uncharacterized protein LOC133034511 [Cannabis sativa]|uniref:uncharacterized protein LOC133034511 n=1 Tax=Cannabis sativa TaxID=3483 RepID=UPI0029C9ECAD|nr:uncharacterized protein LOC133034511 [Cannabis sativa]
MIVDEECQENKEDNMETRNGNNNLDYLDDPGRWKNLDNKLIDLLVEKGPIRVSDIEFPKDDGRRFSTYHYTRNLSNGEQHDRKCVNSSTMNQLSNEGTKDWKHLGDRLKSHETRFLNVVDTSGKGLFDELIREIKKLELDINDVRGQSYDNGSNMKGKHQVNSLSKNFQSEESTINVAIDLLKGLISHFKKYMENGFISSMVSARKLANELKIEPKFHEKRVIRRKKQFDEDFQLHL